MASMRLRLLVHVAMPDGSEVKLTCHFCICICRFQGRVVQELETRGRGDCSSVVVCFLRVAAVSSCTSAGKSLRFPPPSLPKLAPLTFAGQPAPVPIRTARTIYRRRFAYQNGVECPAALVDWTTTAYSKRKSGRGRDNEAYWISRLDARCPAGMS